MKTVAFSSVARGVGQTSLVYHLAWMYADLGISVVVADFDPQASLTSMFLDDDRLADLWSDESGSRRTVHGAVEGLLAGSGAARVPQTVEVSPGVALLAGDLALVETEGELSRRWQGSRTRGEPAGGIPSQTRRMLERIAETVEAQIVLMDIGPTLGGISRTALAASDAVVFPLAPDLRSWQSLGSLGAALRTWKAEWQRGSGEGSTRFDPMRPVGYVLLNRPIRLDRPFAMPGRWTERFDRKYRAAILGELGSRQEAFGAEPDSLGVLRSYVSLMALSQEARRPMFFLKPGHGATTGDMAATQECYREFNVVAKNVAARCGVALR